MSQVIHTAPSVLAIATENHDFNPPGLPTGATSSASLVLDGASMDKMIRLADVMACGRSTIPKHLQGNAGDCLAVVMQAIQWGMNPFAVAQKTHIVNGALGYEAQLVAAVINNSGLVLDRFHYDWFGDWEGVIGKTDKSHDKGVRIWATLKGESEPRELIVTMAEAGVRNSPLWEQAPKIQLSYLAAKRWARLYAPDVILGVYTPDEFEPPKPQQTRHVDPSTGEIASPPTFDLQAEKHSASLCETVDQLRDYLKGALARAVAAKDKHGGAAIKAYVLELVDILKNATIVDAPVKPTDPMAEHADFIEAME